MDNITRHYKHKCEVLSEEINKLKRSIANEYFKRGNAILNEDATTASVMPGTQSNQYTNEQLDQMVQDLLKPQNWSNPDYWRGYGSAGEYLGTLLGMYQQKQASGRTLPSRRRIA